MDLNDIRRRFDTDGYAVLRGLLPPAVLQGVRADLEAWVEGQAQELREAGAAGDAHADAPFEVRLARLFAGRMERAPKSLRRELHWAGMFGLFFHAPLLDVVERLLGTPEIRLYPNYTVRPKFPEDPATEVLWHQDAGYTASGQHGRDEAAGEVTVEALRMVNVWAPLVPARRANGCMQFVPGTHRVGLARHERREHYLEIAAQDLARHGAGAVDMECDPGDVIVFSNMLYHRGLPNATDTIRWSCDWRYQDAAQSTMRAERGHLARSAAHPDDVVASAAQWTALEFQ